MPLSYFRRPLALAAISYIVLLIALRAIGWRKPQVPEAWVRLSGAPCVRLAGTIASGFSENRLGERILLRASGAGRCGSAALFSRDPFPELLFRVYDRYRNDALPPVGVMLSLPRGMAGDDLLPGRTAVVEGALRPARWPRMPGDFDEAGFLAERGALFVLWADRARADGGPVSWRWLPEYWAERMHRSIHRAFREMLPMDAAALLEGLLLGYKGPLEPAVSREIQDAGVMHLLVPSGAKVMLVMAFVFWLAGRLGAGRALRFVLVSVAGGFYVLLVGAGPPYLRAFWCAIAGAGAALLGRESSAFQSLVLSALVILAWHPDDLFSAGFQMSYAAAFGLVLAMPRWVLPARWPGWARTAVAVLAASAVVQLMLAPIMAEIFGRVSMIGILANVPLVPAAGVFMAGGAALWLAWLTRAAMIASPLAALLSSGLQLFAWVCGFFSGLPAAAVDLRPFGAVGVISYYSAVFGALVLPQWRPALAAGMFALILAAVRCAWGRWTQPAVRVAFLSSASSGDAPGWRAMVVWADGRKYWIGSGELTVAAAEKTLEALDIDRLDAVFEAERSVGPWASRELAGRAAEVLPLRDGIGRARNGIRVGVEDSGVVWMAGDLAVRSDPFLRWSTVGSRGREAGAPPEFCILQLPSKNVPRGCSPERSFDTAKQGAVWVTSDGQRHKLRTQRQIYSISGPVP